LEKAVILDLVGGAEFIRVTAEYSNAVIVAVMPYVSDCAQKLDLPIPHPTTTAHVLKCAVVPIRDASQSVVIQGDWVFWFGMGRFKGFQGPHSYFSLQDPDQIPKFYGTNRMSKDEAISLARQTLTKLGVKLETVFAEQEPHVTGPLKLGTNVVPHFRIEWPDPRSSDDSMNINASVNIEVDGEVRRVEKLWFSGFMGPRVPQLSTGLPPPTIRRPPPQANPAYAWALVPIVLRALDEYGQKLALPIPRPLTTNQVARFFLADNEGWPHCEVELTNGWRFIYRNSMVNGYYAPDNLFSSDRRQILIKDFIGKWRMTEPDAIKLVKNTLAKLNYPANLVHTDFQPAVRKPAVPGIPRYSIAWWYKINPDADDLQSKVEAEVDADRGELKSLYYDDKSYWNQPPPINLPISLPQPRSTGQPPVGPPGRLPLNKPPTRPQSAFNPPVPK
jgi:hypothetical protein